MGGGGDTTKAGFRRASIANLMNGIVEDEAMDTGNADGHSFGQLCFFAAHNKGLKDVSGRRDCGGDVGCVSHRWVLNPDHCTFCFLLSFIKFQRQFQA